MSEEVLASGSIDAAAAVAPQAADETAQRFTALISSALLEGRAHLTMPSGEAPLNPTAWGWRNETTLGQDGSSTVVQRPQGDRIGWVDGDNVYLDPKAAFHVAEQMSIGGRPSATLRTLKKRFFEGGLLASRDVTRGVYTIRRTVNGSRKEVLHLRPGVVGHVPPDRGQADQPGESETEHQITESVKTALAKEQSLPVQPDSATGCDGKPSPTQETTPEPGTEVGHDR